MTVETMNEENIAKLAGHIATNFVRRNNAYYSTATPTASLNASDVKRLALRQFKQQFPEVELTQPLVRRVFQHSMEEYHNDETQTVQIWDGSMICRPDMPGSILFDTDLVRLNTWVKPEYRSLPDRHQDMSFLTTLLDRIFPETLDRSLFIDWLSWCLQNEHTKPGWAIMLYSRHKGTGKSTLCNLVKLLFGTKNTRPINGISKLTNRFNMPIVASKLVIAEEVELTAGSTQGNSLKTLVTESEVTTEGKGKEAETLPQCCCFLLTSNHFPNWIEAHERRYLVIDVDHSGHASGPDAAAFAEFIGELHTAMKDDANIARLYNALMVHRPSNAFDPASLNVAAIDTPIMARVREGTTEVVLDQLSEWLQASNQFAFPQTALLTYCQEKLRANSARIRHLMNDLGWVRHQVKWGGYDYARVLWVHPDYYVAEGRVRGVNGYDEPVDRVADEMDIV